MIRRPENLLTVKIDLEFRNSYFTQLEINLDHINKDGRSSFSEKDIAIVTNTFINRENFDPVEKRFFDNEHCIYFAHRKKFNGRYYKLVWCVCSDKPKTIGIITFHRIKR